jgi:hypothetical protein
VEDQESLVLHIDKPFREFLRNLHMIDDYEGMFQQDNTFHLILKSVQGKDSLLLLYNL